MLLTKDFETIQEPVKLQDPDLAAIRKYAQRDVEPSEVWCSAFKVCNTKLDRSGEQFTKAYLERFAETLPGKAVLEGHRRDIRPVGRLYSAEVLPDGGDWFLKGYWYTAADSPIKHEVELGIAKDCSVGYVAGKRTCSIDGKMWLPHRQGECRDHQPLEEYDGKRCTINYCDSEVHKAELQEVSLVWLGCQYGAEATAKQFAMGWNPPITGDQIARTYTLGNGISVTLPFPPTASPPPKESGMSFDTIEKAVAEIERLKALPLSAAREAELQKALADKEPLAKDGEAYRTWIKGEMTRLAGVLDATRDGGLGKGAHVEAILSEMPNASAESLLKFLKPLQDEVNAKLAGGTGDPDASERLDENGRPKKKSSPFGRFANGGLF